MGRFSVLQHEGFAPSSSSPMGQRAGTTYTQGLCRAIELAAPTAFLGKRRIRDAGSAGGSLHPPSEQGGLKVMRRSSWTMARQSLEPRGTKGSQPSTHQRMMSRDTATCGEAQCEGVEKKAKFSLFQRCSTHSCWGPGLGGWLLPWYKSAEGCRVGPSAVILKGWTWQDSGSLAVGSHPPHLLSFLPFSSMCLTPSSQKCLTALFGKGRSCQSQDGAGLAAAGELPMPVLEPAAPGDASDC